MGVTVGVGVGGAVGVRLGKSEGAAVGTGVPGTAAGQPLLALLGMVHGCGCGIIHGTTCAAVVAHPAVAIIAVFSTVDRQIARCCFAYATSQKSLCRQEVYALWHFISVAAAEALGEAGAADAGICLNVWRR